MSELAKVRRSKGFSQRALANEAGVSPSSVYEIEVGRRKPNPSTLRKIADALGVEVIDLLEEEERPKVSPVPLSREWALAAPVEELARELKRANLTEVLLLLRDLHTAAEGAAGEEWVAVLERIDLVVGRLVKIGGTDPIKLAKRWDTPSDTTQEEQEGREAG